MLQNINNKLGLSDNSSINKDSASNKYDYSKFSQLDEFDWDYELEAKFSPIAEKLNLSQESVDMLIELALEMSRKQKGAYEQDDVLRHQNLISQYNQLFSEDSEIPNKNSSKLREYMSLANSVFSDFCSPKLKEVLTQTGLVYHPELIKLFHKLGELSQEDNLSHYGQPFVEELTPAQILYGTKN